jgi:hypothetical protein
MAALTDTELGAIIANQVRLARDHDKSELNATRTKALNYFFGRMDEYVPPEPNRSKVVSRDVADTMGWMMPQLMRVFTASDRFAHAEPVEEGDVDFAEQATEGLNYVFWKDNDGEAVCYDATWDALLFQEGGIVKTYYDDTPQFAVSFHSGLTEDQVAMLLGPDENGNEPEVLASSSRQEYVTEMQADPMTGQPVEAMVPITVWDCKIKRQKAKGRFIIEAIPPEDYLKDSEATCSDDALFQAHRDEKTRSDLIEMGFDRKKVEGIAIGSRSYGGEEYARDPRADREDASDTSTELVDYYECFAKIDVDDDGVAEMVRVIMAGPDGGTLLDWEIWEDDSPFDAIQYEPIPHRFEGRSVFDKTQDVQDIKTVLERQGLNNLYATNNPQRFAKGNIRNPEELTNPSFNGTVFGDANAEIIPLPVPFVAANAFEAMGYQDEVIQRRTGVGRQSMALDPEALQNQSATANQNNKDAAYSQVELAARNMAKGWKKVFRKLLRLMVKHQDTPRAIRLRGDEFVTIDPRHWNTDMDVSINVGLGTGSRDRDMAMLQQVLMNQMAIADRFLASGATEDAIDMLPKVIATMTKIAESAGLRSPDDFYPGDAEEIVQRLKQKAAEAVEKPDPEIVKAQMDQQAKDAQAQRDHEYRMSQLAAKQEMDRTASENKLALDKYQTDQELLLKQWQISQEMAMNERLGVHKANMASDVQLGGNPG